LEARFIILHPDDPGEILLATALIRCLKTQVEEALVYSVVKKSHKWLLESNPHLDEIFVYEENPKELLDQLKDFLPDYLIDLNGRREVRRFKNRLKVLDFTISRKHTDDLWPKRAFETCRLFDVHDDGKGPEYSASALDPELLPSEFLNGYLVLSLDSLAQARPLSDDQIIDLAVMIEKPIVVTGSVTDRDLANRIGQYTGCAVFPTCGDLSPAQIGSLFGQAKGVIVFDSIWEQVSTASKIDRLAVTGNSNLPKLQDIAVWARSLFQKNHGRTSSKT
jgi:ADP-heptose:LPS heptosyltransferase